MSEFMEIQSHRGPYRVYFELDALERLNTDVPENAHFIVDRHVAELYHDQMANIVNAPSVLLVDATEDNKSLIAFPAYVQHLVEHGIRRDHVLIAIGGGIIQDITCFLGATLLRGIEWQFYPTTLLAQSDSCIGSKSSINAGQAKNILGTFTPPHEIHIGTRFLDTLDERDIRSGIGEMLKVHVIDGPKSFDAIAADYQRIFDDQELMVHYVRRSLEIKKRYIEKDEFDLGLRNIFNYGHSFGHAIESATNFAVPHGIAVTIGMDMANYTAMKLGVCHKETFTHMHPVLFANYHGFENCPVSIDNFVKAISKDKKNLGTNSVTLILLNSDGHVFKGSYKNNTTFHDICNEYLERVRAT